MHNLNKMLVIISSGILSACSSINSQFDCPLKAGIRCENIDSVNARVDRGEIVSSSALLIAPRPPISYQASAPLSSSFFKNKNSEPLRTSETVMRVWFAPFEDRQGNYHLESEIYTVIKPGSWLEASEKEIEGV